MDDTDDSQNRETNAYNNAPPSLVMFLLHSNFPLLLEKAYTIELCHARTKSSRSFWRVPLVV